MGLDTVEFVMEVEDAFGVRLSDDACSEIRTVGEFIRYVEHVIHRTTGAPCPSARAFYDLRRELRLAMDQPGLALRPDTDLAAAIPLPARSDVWRHLSACGLVREPLWLPRWMRRAGAGGSVASAVLVLAALVSGGAGAAVVVGMVIFVLFIVLMMPVGFFRTQIPPHLKVVRNVVHWIVHPLAPDRPCPTREQIRSRVIEITAAFFGADPSTINDDTQFVRDLGA